MVSPSIACSNALVMFSYGCFEVPSQGPPVLSSSTYNNISSAFTDILYSIISEMDNKHKIVNEAKIALFNLITFSYVSIYNY